jgi:Uri superfamily endonuclease
MNTANQMAEEIYGLHCDIGRLEKEKEHWHTEFINEHEYAHMLEEQAEKTEAENAKLRELIADVHEALCADKAGLFHKLTLASMEDDMRELGIEVD